MPSPIGHALGGLIVAAVFAPRAPHGVHEGHEGHEEHEGYQGLGSARVRRWASACAVVACLPDVDFLWGRHNMETHSIGFAVLIALGVFAWTRARRWSVAGACAVATHVLFDWLGSDDVAPIGVMALWPISTTFYFADAWLFGAISRHYWRDDFLLQNTLAVMRELLILLPILGVAIVWKRRQ